MSRLSDVPIERPGSRACIRLTREGGVAYLPALARPREVAMAECSAPQQRAVREALDEARAHGCPPTEAGRGDQRYFRIVIACPDDPNGEETLIVPEAQAPGALVKLWESGPQALSDRVSA